MKRNHVQDITDVTKRAHKSGTSFQKMKYLAKANLNARSAGQVVQRDPCTMSHKLVSSVKLNPSHSISQKVKLLTPEKVKHHCDKCATGECKKFKDREVKNRPHD